jgi:cytoskeletal protein RodZ
MDIAARLKQAREDSGKSLQDVARATKISAFTLEALEHGDFSRLPGGIFARAFVRAYAQEVHLDPEPIVDELVRTWPAATLDPPAEPETAGAPVRFRWVAVLGAILVLAAAATGAYLWLASQPLAVPRSTATDRGTR